MNQPDYDTCIHSMVTFNIPITVGVTFGAKGELLHQGNIKELLAKFLTGQYPAFQEFPIVNSEFIWIARLAGEDVRGNSGECCGDKVEKAIAKFIENSASFGEFSDLKIGELDIQPDD